ncbi:MAG TPA: hotdog domain-containing protein [Bacteroidales bacterium]|nr:hotdog domain-containing protein [Bacteroidales bacterium]HPT12701.1 hotdog domain-containing protein [Bacteroidales bacterium]
MEKKVIEPVINNSMRLVKSEDLNHHGTLFAGRTAEWFVESGFISCASVLNPRNVVCLKIHGMYFTSPAKPGEVLTFSSRIVYSGTTSLVSYIKVTRKGIEKPLVDGFVTFIHVDDENKPMAHNIEIHPVTQEDIELYEMAKNLKK